MKGIPCNEVIFNDLNNKVHQSLLLLYPNYNAEKWSNIDIARKNKVTGEFLFPVKQGVRGNIIKKLLTKEQKDSIINITKKDTDWYPDE